MQWRKLMLGTGSAQGEHAVERRLTIVRTCQLQQLNALVYLTAAITAHRRWVHGRKHGCSRVTVLLVYAQHLKQVPGRKSDVQDSAWIAQLLENGLHETTYEELGADYFQQRHRERHARRHVRQLEQLGYRVTLTPAAVELVVTAWRMKRT